MSSRELLKEDFWIDKNVIVSGGGSIEKIDDVRCITNFSSGKQANALAYAFYLAGANVTLISSNPDKKLAVNIIQVNSSKEYKNRFLRVFWM